MSSTAILVENLGKEYHVGAAKERHDSVRDALAHSFRRMWSRRDSATPDTHSVWALRNVSFDVRQGEVLGVVGKNGAGKSTLLKLLSRITKPTEGRARIYGRVGSLLEVGTGFHPDLTGRDNIYLNGAILGMDRAYMDSRFDEIVEFSEVERFIDTPVKRYSSGMYLRLAFAVAAHLETEILIVDEVLAVGDAEFQRKCIGKMGDVTKSGRTVLFVSHNMAAVQGLCTRAILIERGRLAAAGHTDDIVSSYMKGHGGQRGHALSLTKHVNRRSGCEVILQEVTMESDGAPTNVVQMGGSVTWTVRYERDCEVPNMRFGFVVENPTGQRLLTVSSELQGCQFPPSQKAGVLTCHVPAVMLVPGAYYLTLILASSSTDHLDRIDQAFEFSVESADVYGTGYAPTSRHGLIYAPATMTYQHASAGGAAVCG